MIEWSYYRNLEPFHIQGRCFGWNKVNTSYSRWWMQKVTIPSLRFQCLLRYMCLMWLLISVGHLYLSGMQFGGAPRTMVSPKTWKWKLKYVVFFYEPILFKTFIWVPKMMRKVATASMWTLLTISYQLRVSCPRRIGWLEKSNHSTPIYLTDNK